MIEDIDYIGKTKEWIKEFIIRYTICPFARIPFENDLIRFWVKRGLNPEEILLELASCYTIIMTTASEELSNGFLILPSVSNDFQQLLDIFDYANLLLKDMHLENELQIVPFHPQFRFAGENKDDYSNLVNRSPFAMLHILREQEVEKAISSHPDISQVPKKNRKLLRGLPQDEIARILYIIE